MNKKFMVLSLVSSLFITTSLYGCNAKDKEIVLSKNVQSDIKSTENEILEYMTEGKSYLKENNFDSAKTSFENAISKDKSKSDIYIEIKDIYMEAMRYDDAYYFIKLAVDNNIDKDNMLTILDDIKQNFEVITHNITTKLNSNYSVYEYMNIPIEINGKSINLSVKLDNISQDTVLDTSKETTHTFNGTSYEYGREIVINIIVRKPEIKKTLGFITNYYESNGSSYISFDDAEMLSGEEGDKAYIEDGKPYGESYHCYYLRNNNSSPKDYRLSKDCENSLLIYNNSIENELPGPTRTNVNINTLKDYIKDSLNKYTDNASDRTNALLFYITTEDDVVKKIEMQYTP